MFKIVHITTVDISLRYLLLNQLLSIMESEYEVFTISSPGPNVPLIENNEIAYIPVIMTRRFSPFKDFISLINLFWVLRREKFTIVHTHTPKPSLLGQVAARLAGIPIVINTLHGFYFHDNMSPSQRKFYIVMEKIAALCSDIILSQNGEDIETAIREGICRRDRIKLLGNGIDLGRFNSLTVDRDLIEKNRQSFRLKEDDLVVGFVGRLVVEKGFLELLEAAPIILESYPNTKFLIIGPIDIEKSDVLTPEIVEEYGLQDAFIFTGMREDMPELYSLMDVFTLPSHREGFPRSAMEASAMGIPSVLTNIRGCREVVENGRNGFLVPLKDHLSLAQAILALLSDHQGAQQMGRYGVEIAAEKFDEQKVFAKVKEEYKRLLFEKGLLTLKGEI